MTEQLGAASRGSPLEVSSVSSLNIEDILDLCVIKSEPVEGLLASSTLPLLSLEDILSEVIYFLFLCGDIWDDDVDQLEPGACASWARLEPLSEGWRGG